MRGKIYIKGWLKLKPYNTQTITDSYYLKICNEIKAAVLKDNQSINLLKFIDQEQLDSLFCYLTSYLEDIISQTNIWASFVSKHQQLYKKWLPFYSTEEYYDDEINIQDINFLIWYFINAVQQRAFVSPFNDVISAVANLVMEIFDEAWEVAPENEQLALFYKIREQETDFYIARYLIDSVLFKTYLFYPDTGLKLSTTEQEIFEENKGDELLKTFLDENRDICRHEYRTRLLGLSGKEWAAEILGIDHQLSKDILAISPKIKGFFLYKEQNEKEILIEHIASGRQFNLTKKSFDYGSELTEADMIAYLSIVLWQQEWWFSGVYFAQHFDADLILKEKNSVHSRKQVDFLDHKTTETEELLATQLATFIEYNNESQIKFLPAKEIEHFARNFLDYYNKSLKLPEGEKGKAKERARKEGFFGGESEEFDYSDFTQSGLVFFNPNRGVEMSMGINGAFPLKNNPFFEQEDNTNDTLQLLMSPEVSVELVHYCLDNCNDTNPFLNEGIGKLYQEDLDFLLRFWKKENYFTKPNILYTGATKK